MTKIKNKVVLVTGGASGIGKMMGEKCLKDGAERLVIWDINEQNLQQVTESLRKEGYTVHPYVVDVADVASIEKAAAETLAEVKRVDILFNNAGIVAGSKEFHEHSAADIERTMRINSLGVMHVARMFLPTMIENGVGHIINIASAAGLTPNPKMSVYAGSKWAVVGWSESLRLELEAMKKKELHVTTVCPSFITTGMFAGVKEPLLTPALSPEKISQRIIEAVKDNEIMVIEPLTAKLVPVLRGLLPTRLYDFVAGDIFDAYGSMNSFVGRKKE